MATQGPLFPGTVTTEVVGAESNDNWLNTGNISADDGAEASLIHPSFDAGVITSRLKAQNFGFTIPAGSTIDGITVEIEKRDQAIGNAQDERVQLLDAAGALVGDNKGQLTTAWPTAATIISYGGAADTWNATPTVAMVNDPDFGVVLSVEATAANTDIFVDFIRVTITYTPPADVSDAEFAGTLVQGMKDDFPRVPDEVIGV